MISLNKRTSAAWAALRERRDKYLAITDSYMLPDRCTEVQHGEVVTYRAALRDLPDSTISPALANWPQPPAFIKELTK